MRTQVHFAAAIARPWSQLRIAQFMFALLSAVEGYTVQRESYLGLAWCTWMTGRVEGEWM